MFITDIKLFLTYANISPITDVRSKSSSFTPCRGRKHLTSSCTSFMSFLLEASIDRHIEVIVLKSTLSSSNGNSAQAFKISATCLFRIRLNFTLNKCEISFKPQSAYLKLRCVTVRYTKAASLPAIIFLSWVPLHLKNGVTVYELTTVDTMALCLTLLTWSRESDYLPWTMQKALP